MLKFDFTKSNVSMIGGVPVVVEQGRDYEVGTADFKKYWSLVLYTGGACMLAAEDTTPENFWDKVRSGNDLEVPREAAETTAAVALLGVLDDFLSPKEVEAIYWHEVGHYVHGHNMSWGDPTLSALEREFQADDYAVTRIGAKPMMKALVKIKKIGRIAKGVKNARRRQVKRMHKLNTDLDIRIRRLKKML